MMRILSNQNDRENRSLWLLFDKLLFLNKHMKYEQNIEHDI